MGPPKFSARVFFTQERQPSSANLPFPNLALIACIIGTFARNTLLDDIVRCGGFVQKRGIWERGTIATRTSLDTAAKRQEVLLRLGKNWVDITQLLLTGLHLASRHLSGLLGLMHYIKPFPFRHPFLWKARLCATTC